MAQVISKSDHLNRQYRNQVRLFWGLTGGCAGAIALWLLYLFWASSHNLWVVICIPALFFPLIMQIKHAYDKMGVLAAGLRGEKDTLKALKALDDEYWIFSNLTATYKGGHSELDLVVLGPSGLYVVESKQLSGKITGNYADKKWLREKTSRAGVSYPEKIYSPIKQVGTHVYRLANQLRENGFSIHVSSAVYFPHPDARVRLQGEIADTPVFSGDGGQKALLQYLRKSSHPLTAIEVQHIAQFLCEM